MKVAYATIVYKNRRQKYYLFLYKPQFFVIFYFFSLTSYRIITSSVKMWASPPAPWCHAGKIP